MLSRYNTFLSNARSADTYLNRPALDAIGVSLATELRQTSKANIDELVDAMDKGDPIDSATAAKNLLLNIRNALDGIRDTNPEEGSELRNIEDILENHHIIMQNEAIEAQGEAAENKYLSMLHPSFFAADMCCINSRGNMYNVSNPEPWGTVPFDLMPANNVRYGFSFTPVFEHNDTQPYYTRRTPGENDVDFVAHQTEEIWWGINIKDLNICNNCLSMEDFIKNNNKMATDRKTQILEFVDNIISVINTQDPEIVRLSSLVRRYVIAIDKDGVENEDDTASIENELQLAEDDNSVKRQNLLTIFTGFKTTLEDATKT
ncbi:MAG TPA: hypothetical protein VMV86_04070, partial [Methanosarcinales archaeon]|nr:hypothetical protein [Methanosarcinales archaeon]